MTDQEFSFVVKWYTMQIVMFGNKFGINLRNIHGLGVYKTIEDRVQKDIWYWVGKNILILSSVECHM